MSLDDQMVLQNNVLNFSFQDNLILFTINLGLLFWLNGEHNVDNDDNVTTILYSLELFHLPVPFGLCHTDLHQTLKDKSIC